MATNPGTTSRSLETPLSTTTSGRRPAALVRVPKAAEIVAAEMRRQIITGDLEEGVILAAESDLMAHFGVSRPTLREAFRILESESLIEVKRGARGGARVSGPSEDTAARHLGYVLGFHETEMADVYRARELLERTLAREAVRAIDPDRIARLRTELDAGQAALSNPEEYAAHDVSFHLLVAQLADNSTVITMLSMIYHIVVTARRRYAEGLPPGELDLQNAGIQKSHARFVELLDAGDGPGAEAVWGRHMTTITSHFMGSPLAQTVVDMMI